MKRSLKVRLSLLSNQQSFTCLRQPLKLISNNKLYRLRMRGIWILKSTIYSFSHLLTMLILENYHLIWMSKTKSLLEKINNIHLDKAVSPKSTLTCLLKSTNVKVGLRSTAILLRKVMYQVKLLKYKIITTISRKSTCLAKRVFNHTCNIKTKVSMMSLKNQPLRWWMMNFKGSPIACMKTWSP